MHSMVGPLDQDALDQVDGDVLGREAANSPVRVHRATILAISLATGITLGWLQPQPTIWPWLIASGAMLVCAGIIRIRSGVLSMVLLAGATVALGAGWVTLRQHFASNNDLATFIGDESSLVRVRGMALGPPVLRTRTGGAMAKFDYRPPATYFPMRIDAVLARDGSATAVRGEVLVRIDESVAPFRAGDRIETIGFLLRPASPRNPGEIDYRQYAASLGQAGILTVAGRDLLTVTPAPRGTVLAWFLNWRDDLRRRASAWLLADLPQTDQTARDALLANLLLGERDAQIDSVYNSFQRIGLAHILAISGFHLGVLAAFVLLLARLIGGFHRWHGWLVIAAVLLYLMLVEVHMPVLRAGVMTIAASLGLVSGGAAHISTS